MNTGAILDVNCFSHVFCSSDKRHVEFEDFLNWLCYGPGYLVYGGSKYIKELKSASRYLRLFSMLHQFNKAMTCDCDSVDKEMTRIQNTINNPDFDDPHLAAIVLVSSCRLICTGDQRCIRFLKLKEVYEDKVKPPKFYTGKKCNGLLRQTKTDKRHTLKKIRAGELMSIIDEFF